ncbi:hypothetical protein Gasu2_07460 [Galdieria sulphuraria]|nr:hypothetical protein Gasu2_07460 [Galdieria sulphuraria]
MLKKLFDVCILDWNSVASQTLKSNPVIPLCTRPVILSEKSLIILGTRSIPLQPSYLKHELFAVSFSDCLSHTPMTLQWNGYVTTCAIDDVISISSDKIVAAFEDSSLHFFQIENDQLLLIDSITKSHLQSNEESLTKATIREMAYSINDKTLWCAHEDGSLTQYHILSGQWMNWSPIRHSFSSIQVVDSVPHMITTSTDYGIFYAWDIRQRREAFHWNAHKQEMFSHHVKENDIVMGYGDGYLSLLDMRCWDDDDQQQNHVTWITTGMKAIGNICHFDNCPRWCLFGSPSSEVWTWNPYKSNDDHQHSYATRLWKVTCQENDYSFYAMQGKLKMFLFYG